MSKETENTSKRTVVKGALRVLRLDTLQADDSYQRPVKARHKRIVTDFNEEALGVPLIGERADGSLWIVDGLQRVTALRKLGKREVRAEVFASRGPEHEAEVFKLVNLNRTRLLPTEEFRALLTSHDEQAWKLKQVVEECGFRMVLGKTSSRDRSGIGKQAALELTCTSTLLQINKRWGLEPIRFALTVIPQAWPGDPQGSRHDILGGLATYHHRQNGIVDLDRLLPRLRGVTAQKVLYTAKQMTLSNNMWESVADVIDRLNRKRRA